MERPPAVIMGLSLTALGVIRSLGRKKIPVIGLDYQEGQIASYSKFCRTLLCCPDPEKTSSELLTFMRGLANKFQNKAVLIPTNDEFVLFVSRNREQLSMDFNFILTSSDVIETLNDKKKINQIAEENNIPVPRTFFLKEIVDLDTITKIIDYPCVIKPAYGYLYKYLKFKAIMVNNTTELMENYRKLHQYSNNMLIQEFVSGRDDEQYSLGAYFNADYEPIAIFTAKKFARFLSDLARVHM